MVTEQYVSFETAKLLKKKGFDEYCIYVYLHDGSEGLWNDDKEDIECQKPTQSLVIRWLREVCNILISIEVYCIIESPIWCYKYYNLHKDYIKISSQYKSYEEACEAAIKYCLENLV